MLRHDDLLVALIKKTKAEIEADLIKMSENYNFLYDTLKTLYLINPNLYERLELEKKCKKILDILSVLTEDKKDD
mgnify:CR=1 FL=1